MSLIKEFCYTQLVHGHDYGGVVRSYKKLKTDAPLELDCNVKLGTMVKGSTVAVIFKAF